MTTSQHTPDPRPVFDGHRLAISYAEAMLAGDDDQAAAILTTLTEARLRRNFFIGLTVTTQHALRLSQREPDDVLRAYREQLDQTEQQAHETGQETTQSLTEYRLAATYMTATFDQDNDFTSDIRATLTDDQNVHSFLAGLVGITEYALTYRPGCTPTAFVAAYRAVLDQAERKAS